MLLIRFNCAKLSINIHFVQEFIGFYDLLVCLYA